MKAITINFSLEKAHQECGTKRTNNKTGQSNKFFYFYNFLRTEVF